MKGVIPMSDIKLLFELKCLSIECILDSTETQLLQFQILLYVVIYKKEYRWLGCILLWKDDNLKNK